MNCDGSILGVHGDKYILNSYNDWRLIKDFAKDNKMELPSLTVSGFDQEKYVEWMEIAPSIDPEAPPVVTNTILQCIDDNSGFAVRFTIKF